MKKLLLVSLLIPYFVCSQDPNLSQYENIQSYINPAMACNDSADVAGIKFRNQWPSFSGNYVTTMVDYNHYHVKSNGSSYLRYMNDRAGKTIAMNEITFGYSQKLNLGENILLQMGGEIGYYARSIDTSKITFGDQIDPRRGFIYQTSGTTSFRTARGFDISTGFLVSFKSFYTGLSLAHFNQPNISLTDYFVRWPQRWSAQAGINHAFSNGYLVSPYILSFWQADNNITQLGLNCTTNFGLYVGVSHRLEDAWIFQLGYTGKSLMISYGFDVLESALTETNAYSHELSARFRFWEKSPKHRFLMF